MPWNKIVFLVALLASSQALSQVYQCTGDEGRKVFSSSPCGPDAHQLSEQELTPTSGGLLGVPRQHSGLTSDSPAGFSVGQTGQPVDKQKIATRYADLSSIVDWLIGNHQPALLQGFMNDIRFNQARAMRAEGIRPNENAINIRFDEQLEQLQRQHLGDSVNLARAWISLEAERDTALYLFNTGFNLDD